MFKPDYCLFEYSSHAHYTLTINPRSNVNADHLQYFRFIGRVMGMAIFHQKFLDVFFVPPFYKLLLGLPLVVQDLEAFDASFYRSVQWMLENEIAGVMDDQTFSVEEEQFGVTTTHDLIPDGRNVTVNDENKAQWAQLVTEFRIRKRVQEQLQAVQTGLYEIIPKEALAPFDAGELEVRFSLRFPSLSFYAWARIAIA